MRARCTRGVLMHGFGAGEVRDGYLPDFLVEHATTARCLDRHAQLDAARRRVEHETLRPGRGGRGTAVPVGGAVDASAASGERPRNTRSPWSSAASSDTRPAGSRRTPGSCGSGSHTRVTRVLPLSARSVPIHVRTYFPDCTDVEIDASAFWIAFGASGGGAEARTASSTVAAQ